MVKNIFILLEEYLESYIKKNRLSIHPYIFIECYSMTKILLILLILVLSSCNKDELNLPIPDNLDSKFISAVDISRYPEITSYNPLFFDLGGTQKDFLDILKENKINTIRLRLWVKPDNEHSDFNEVKQFSQVLKSKGFRIWLSLHYSDTWADPGHQETPLQWQGIGYPALKDSVYNYTQKVVNKIHPDYIQIGNEINSGILFPFGNIDNEPENFKELLNAGITAVRKNSTNTKIILHYAGIKGANYFFNQVRSLDYDIIGLSFYPIWHGKSLDSLQNAMQVLTQNYNKNIVIAETAYPFTLDANDWTNNIVGLEEQLILPDFPATNEGQKNFVAQIKTITKNLNKGIGFCYWGAELIAWKGKQSTNASPWENQALFDFNNKALPALKEFSAN